MLTCLKGVLMTVEGRTCSITFFVSWFWMHTLILLLFELHKFQHLHFDPIRYQECSLNMWTPLRHYNDERVNSRWMAMFRTRKRGHGICCWSKEGPQEIGLGTLPKIPSTFCPWLLCTTFNEVHPNEFSFNSAMSSCEKGSQWQISLEFLDMMAFTMPLCMPPDIFSFCAAISSCEKAGEWQRALQIFEDCNNCSIVGRCWNKQPPTAPWCQHERHQWLNSSVCCALCNDFSLVEKCCSSLSTRPLVNGDGGTWCLWVQNLTRVGTEQAGLETELFKMSLNPFGTFW